MGLSTRAASRLAGLEAADLLRQPPAITRRSGVRYELAGHRVVGFCSNDYLGLATETTRAVGPATGAGASRLIAGDLPEHRDVEARLATLCGAEDAVLFPSGFQLNVGVLPCLVESSDVVHSDRLNHASIIDGLRLARAQPYVIDHGTHPEPPPRDRTPLHWWITESVFSMDGDRVDAHAVSRFQDAGGTVYVDEAHAFGLFRGGAGLFHDSRPRPDVLVGTLSKAYGCAGAFVAASAPICRLIRNRARSFVFSTGTAPTVVADIRDRVETLAGPRGDELRAALWRNARCLDAALHDRDPGASDPPSPIFPLVVGDNATAVRIAADLLQRGLHVQAIRPPTVPEGTARLRVTVSAAHSVDQVLTLAHELQRSFADRGRPLKVSRGLPQPTPAAEAF